MSEYLRKWSGLDTFDKVSVAMILLWGIGTCAIIAGYKVIGCVLIW